MKKKGFKINYQYQRRHSIYIIMGLVIVILFAFLISNFGKCKVYSLSLNSENYKSANGIMILTNNKNILKMSNVLYTGNIENVKSVEASLCVEVDSLCNNIYTVSSYSNEGMSYKDYLNRLTIDINEARKSSLYFTSKVRRYASRRLYMKLIIEDMDGNTSYEMLPFEVELEYANNKIIY